MDDPCGGLRPGRLLPQRLSAGRRLLLTPFLRGHGRTCSTACSASSSLSTLGDLPRPCSGQCSSDTLPPSSTAHTLMLPVNTKEAEGCEESQSSTARAT